MSTAAHTPGDVDPAELIAPTEERWRALSPSEREALIVRTNSLLSDEEWLAPEGRQHDRARSVALDMLGQHFSRIGRRIYFGSNMAIHYPGERMFAPDLFAVLDVEDTGDADERLAWIVADEGRGLDFVLEVLHHGDRRKDLIENVERYARLRIPEYFIYERGKQQVLGYRLPAKGASRYQPIRSHFGRTHSEVLGLDLAVVEGRLRFFSGAAELPGSPEIIESLGRMIEEVERRRTLAEQERERALHQLRDVVLGILGSRGLAISDAVRAAVTACTDGAQLGRWALRAVAVNDAAELLADRA